VTKDHTAVYLYDRRDGEGAWKGAVTLDNGKVARANVANFGTGSVGTFDPVQVLQQTSMPAKHAIIHADNPESCCTAADFELIVLWVSTQDSRNDPHSILTSPAAIVRFAMRDGNAYRTADSKWLPEFLKLTFEQAKQLARFKTRTEASGWESDNPGFEHFLDIILPGRVENLLAFRLLCEATKVVEEENTRRTAKGEQTSNTALLSNITIHAPQTIWEWVRPFGITTPEDPTTQADAQTIEKVAAMVGSDKVKARAKAVLEAVNGNGGTLKTANEKFLNPEANPPGQP